MLTLFSQRYYTNFPNLLNFGYIWKCFEGEYQYNRFEITELGWYNIDKPFASLYRTKIKIDTKFTDCKCFIILDNDRVCLRGDKTSTGFEFKKIPKGKSAKIILYKENAENQSVSFAIKRINTSNNKNITLGKLRVESENTFKRITKSYK